MKYVNIAIGVLGLLCTILSYYLAIKNKITKAAGDAINSAEELDKIGKEKMQIAVTQIVALIPPILRPIFSDKFVEQLVQEAFDKMQYFARKQAKKGVQDKK